jgi:murein DD-endopeptidase MepM/ murein hydrolase activator NlpD
MEKFTIGDIFIGNFPISQYFGQSPDLYKRWGLLGHNGLDFALPLYTPVLAGVDGEVDRVGEDKGGYGLYVRIWSQSQKILLLFAHLFYVFVKPGQSVSWNSVIALSGNSGNSTGPHLHFGLAPANEKREKLYPSNGYGGYINPLDIKRVSWNIRDPQGLYANYFKR